MRRRRMFWSSRFTSIAIRLPGGAASTTDASTALDAAPEVKEKQRVRVALSGVAHCGAITKSRGRYTRLAAQSLGARRDGEIVPARTYHVTDVAPVGAARRQLHRVHRRNE